jgi:hypothetical protein
VASLCARLGAADPVEEADPRDLSLLHQWAEKAGWSLPLPLPGQVGGPFRAPSVGVLREWCAALLDALQRQAEEEGAAGHMGGEGATARAPQVALSAPRLERSVIKEWIKSRGTLARLAEAAPALRPEIERFLRDMTARCARMAHPFPIALRCAGKTERVSESVPCTLVCRDAAATDPAGFAVSVIDAMLAFAAAQPRGVPWPVHRRGGIIAMIASGGAAAFSFEPQLPPDANAAVVLHFAPPAPQHLYLRVATAPSPPLPPPGGIAPGLWWLVEALHSAAVAAAATPAPVPWADVAPSLLPVSRQVFPSREAAMIAVFAATRGARLDWIGHEGVLRFSAAATAEAAIALEGVHFGIPMRLAADGRHCEFEGATLGVDAPPAVRAEVALSSLAPLITSRKVMQQWIEDAVARSGMPALAFAGVPRLSVFSHGVLRFYLIQ